MRFSLLGFPRSVHRAAATFGKIPRVLFKRFGSEAGADSVGEQGREVS